MKLTVPVLFIEHRSGWFSAQVLGHEDLRCIGLQPADCLADLELVLADRIERTHPAHQSRFLMPLDQRVEPLVLKDFLPVEHAAGTERATFNVSVLISERRGWQTIQVPRFALMAWIAKGTAWQPEVGTLMARHAQVVPAEYLLQRRFERREWLETLILEVEPPPLSAFRKGGVTIYELPPPGSEKEAASAEDKKKKPPETPTLKQIGVSLSALAENKALERAHGQESMVRQLATLLEAPGEKALVLVGAASVGKTTVLNELVYRLRDPQSSERLRARPVWFCDASRLVATEGWFGEWQRQTLDVLAECEAAQVIWYVGNLLPLLDAGKHVGSEHNVAEVLKPYLTGRRVTIIGECRTEDWSKLELRDAGFARLFVVQRLEEPAAEVTHGILESIAKDLAQDGPQITPEGILTARLICRRYVNGSSLLGATAHFLRRLVDQDSGANVIGPREVVRTFATESGIPEILLRDDLPLDPAEVSRALSDRLVGQPAAVRRMVDLVAVIKAGLSEPTRPLGSFLFVGPTGVGKTETAKALARYLFGSDDRLVRFDMSEYVAWDAVSRFLGDAQTEGKLVESLRRQPFAVVLLDELEKANPAIFDVLLQVLGEGRLTDEAGRTASFVNAVIVMTSNLGVATWKARMGFDSEALAAAYQAHFFSEAERFFRPELMNRIDHVVPFLPLEAPQIRAIAGRELTKFVAREGLRQRGVELQVDLAVPDWLAARGTDPRYGARPLKRALERSLAIPLARQLSRIKASGFGVRIGVAEDGLSLERLEQKGAGDESVRDRLETLWWRVTEVALLWRKWTGCAQYLELKEDVRLYEQLSRHRAFWNNRELSEGRSKGMEQKLAILAAAQALTARLNHLEDMAAEAYRSRDLTGVDALAAELRSCTTVLEAQTLELLGYGLVADACTLVLLPSARSRFLRTLLEVYLGWAQQFGWRVTLETAPDRSQILPEKVRKKNPVKATKKEADKKDDSKKEVVERVTDFPLDWELRDEWSSGEVEAHDCARKWAQDWDTQAALALTFRGPHARTRLQFEAGLHRRIEGQIQTDIRLYVLDPGARPQLKDLSKDLRPCRMVNEDQGWVRDNLTNEHLPAKGSLGRTYAEHLQQRIYLAGLGQAGLLWMAALKDY